MQLEELSEVQNENTIEYLNLLVHFADGRNLELIKLITLVLSSVLFGLMQKLVIALISEKGQEINCLQLKGEVFDLLFPVGITEGFFSI